MSDEFKYAEPECVCRDSSLNPNLIAKDMFQMICGNCLEIIEILPSNYRSLEGIPDATVDRLRKEVHSSGLMSDKRLARVFAATLPNLAEALQAAADGDYSAQGQHVSAGLVWSERADFDEGPGLYESIWKTLVARQVLFQGKLLIGTVYQESLNQYSVRSGMKGKKLVKKYPAGGVTTHLLGDMVLSTDGAFFLDKDVRLTIFVDGAEQFTSSMGAAAGIGLPLGELGESALGFGVNVRKNRLRDLRICSLVMTGKTWQTKTFFDANRLQDVRAVLEKLLLTFDETPNRTIDAQSLNSEQADSLLALKNMVESGLIDQEEYKLAKAKILGI